MVQALASIAGIVIAKLQHPCHLQIVVPGLGVKILLLQFLYLPVTLGDLTFQGTALLLQVLFLQD
jgi:hypothetical protein